MMKHSTLQNENSLFRKFCAILIFFGFFVSIFSLNSLLAQEYAQKDDSMNLWNDFLQYLTAQKINIEPAPSDVVLICESASQTLYVLKDRIVVKKYSVSLSKLGIGSLKGSSKTPPGLHRIKEKIGRGAPSGTIFKSRKNTGTIATIYTEPIDVKEDHVTSRILWLEGMEEGKNKGNNVDSHDRFIYIHGTPEEGLIGSPASHGCIRMKNLDVIELFDNAPEGTLVWIR